MAENKDNTPNTTPSGTLVSYIKQVVEGLTKRDSDE